MLRRTGNSGQRFLQDPNDVQREGGSESYRTLSPTFGWEALVTDAGPRAQGPADTIPGNTSTQFTLAIGGLQEGVVNAPGDSDWFRVELVGGQSYVFTSTGHGATPLTDTFLELWGPTGLLVAIDDDAGPGTDSMLRFTATTTGTYWLNARAYEGEGGATLTGGYVVTAAVGSAQNPLHTIDFGYVVPTANITVYFASTGETHQGLIAQRSWTPAEIAAAFAALGTFEDITNLTFTQTFVETGATFVLLLADLEPGVLGQFAPGPTGYGAFDPSGPGWTDQGLQPGGAGFVTLIHEFGHGLGLAHPHDNGSVGTLSSEIMEGVVEPHGSYGTYDLNQGIFTTMSYNDGAPGYHGTSASLNYGRQSTPGPLDIALLQQRYGANTQANAGDTTYTLFDANIVGATYRAIWDVDGIDTITYFGARQATIDLRPATLIHAEGGGGRLSHVSGVQAGFTVAAGVVVENAISGTGDDRLFGGDANNALTANQGNDWLSGGAGDDTLNGGAGMDRVIHAGDPAGVTVDLIGQWAIDGWGAVDTLTSIEEIEGSAHDDILIGGQGGLDGLGWISGGDGNDWIQDNSRIYSQVLGGMGDDVIIGGAAEDSFYGDEGNDTLVGGAGNDAYLWGSDGNDWLDGGDGDDGLDGGDGDDRAFGGAGSDAIVGSGGNDVLIAGAGNDFVYGGSGDDWLDGGAGDDWLEAGEGVNVLIGGEGVDLFVMSESGNWVDLAAGVFSHSLVVGGQTYTTWTVFHDSIDGVVGMSSSNDSLFGNANANVLIGESGDDALVGRDGDDVLRGDSGSDWLVGGDGNDRLDGGIDFFESDVDIYTGGAGHDIFDLGERCNWDVAFDFSPTEDSFDLGGLQWSGFLTIDADGDGQVDDTLLGYAGGNFVALDVSGLTLEQWNGLIDPGSASAARACVSAPVTGEDLSPSNSSSPLLQPVGHDWLLFGA